jgi:protein-S-isoprenylcysteine O-methyltransferase Ste14
VYHRYVVYVEELELKRRFGKNHEEYEKAVPRWIQQIQKSDPLRKL